MVSVRELLRHGVNGALRDEVVELLNGFGLDGFGLKVGLNVDEGGLHNLRDAVGQRRQSLRHIVEDALREHVLELLDGCG